MKNGSVFTFGAQMWLAMQVSSHIARKKFREQVLEMTNHSTKYYCALLVSCLVMLHNSSRIVNVSLDLYISLRNRK